MSEDYTELIENEIAEDGDRRPVEPSPGPAGRAGGPAQSEPIQPPVGDVWNTDKRGRLYIRAQGRNGIIYRMGDETVAQALERDGKPKDQRPKAKKGAKPKQPPAPTDSDLKEIEKVLAEALSSPAFACAMAGDEWGANHFTTQGPVLARNLVTAAQHNPWLRKKLEAAMVGGDLGMALIAIAPLLASAIGYIMPPVVYYLNLPVPERAREMFAIPPRRHAEPETPAEFAAAA